MELLSFSKRTLERIVLKDWTCRQSSILQQALRSPSALHRLRDMLPNQKSVSFHRHVRCWSAVRQLDPSSRMPHDDSGYFSY
eukprot:scaffold5089_cov156-Amphora_coffeaeformis.AAC.8